MPQRLSVGLSLSLSGAYAAMGRQAEAALKLFADDLNAAGGLRIDNRTHELLLSCHDDRSDARRCAEIYSALCGPERVDLLLGPYSSRLARAAAPIAEAAGMVMLNHGGADDGLYDKGMRMLVGVLSPASDYLVGFARLLVELKFWRKRLAIVTTATPFASDVGAGLERACHERRARRRGVRVRLKYRGDFDRADALARLLPALKRNRINALAAAGGFAQDVALMRVLVASNLNLPVLGCVAAGVHGFAEELGEAAEGIVGPSQWEEQARIAPELGPPPGEFARRMRAAGYPECDYPAAQAYAAGLVGCAAIRQCDSLDQRRLRDALGEMRTSTLYGDFAIDRVSGRQIAHKMLLVQWHMGRKAIIEPQSHSETGAIEFPSGWRLVVASMRGLKLKLGGGARDDDESRDEEGD
ncbi:MAG TPA: ABC transporter substrate-binding protein [Candidatus Binataceae bacterium]|nr:ABC transporter substrate-binding protein [Candidatus Binataceae bacterium]